MAGLVYKALFVATVIVGSYGDLDISKSNIITFCYYCYYSLCLFTFGVNFCYILEVYTDILSCKLVIISIQPLLRAPRICLKKSLMFGIINRYILKGSSIHLECGRIRPRLSIYDCHLLAWELIYA